MTDETFTFTLTAEQRATLVEALGDAYAYRNDMDSDDEDFPIDVESRERYAALADALGLDVDTAS